MKYRITKKKIIEAIISEPLEAGMFFDNEKGRGWYSYFIDDGKCSVCAVGAILRKTPGLKNASSRDAENITDYNYCASDLDYAYNTDNFLSKISCEFEGFNQYLNQLASKEDYYEQRPSEKQRQDLLRLHCLMVIEAECPQIVRFQT